MLSGLRVDAQSLPVIFRLFLLWSKMRRECLQQAQLSTLHRVPFYCGITLSCHKRTDRDIFGVLEINLMAELDRSVWSYQLCVFEKVESDVSEKSDHRNTPIERPSIYCYIHCLGSLKPTSPPVQIYETIFFSISLILNQKCELITNAV